MAGDWIKVRENIHEDPAILRMACTLGTRPEHVVGYCVKFWSWVSRNCHDGSVTGVTLSSLENVISLPGFCEMLREVGWLEYSENDGIPSIKIPKFDRHLSEGSKNRALASERKRKSRGEDVTDLSRSHRDKSVTREEKRRIDKEETSNDVSSAASRNGKSKGEPVMEYPCSGSPKTWTLHAAKVREWSESYPGIDALAECRKAWQWCKDNPTRIKTASGMMRFLSSWLSKAQNTARVAPAEKTPASKIPTATDLKNYTPY